jgi:SAM-dependent methyltransferase
MEQQEYHILFEVEGRHFWFRSVHELVVASLRRSCETPLKILDAGCGTGGLMKKLEKLGEVEGIDRSPLAIEYCRKRGLEGAKCADLNTFALPRETYDAITSIDVLYHRAIIDPLSVLKKFHSALKPGGVLFLHLPAFAFLRGAHDAVVHTGHRYTLREAKTLVKEAGFKIEHASYRLMFLFPLVALLRLIRRSSAHSDTQRVHPLINIPLLWLCRIENALSRTLPLPFGVSLYVIARKS